MAYDELLEDRILSTIDGWEKPYTKKQFHRSDVSWLGAAPM